MVFEISFPLARCSAAILFSVMVTACGSGNVESSSANSSNPQSSSSVTSSADSSPSSSSTSSDGISDDLSLVVAINAGSTASATYNGVEYQTDRYSRGGSVNETDDPISGVSEDAVFQSERYGTYSYEIPVTSGTYTIELHLAELYWNASGERTFNLSVEDQTILDAMDLYAEAGHDGAYNYIVDNVSVADGTLDIALEAIEDAGTLSGFAVYSADGELDTSVPVPDCSGYVGLTYDDGPVNTTAFVNALQQASLVPVTFFVNGNNIGNNSSSITQMLSVGEVQSHGYTHTDPGSYGYQQIYDDLQRNNQAIEAAGAPKPTIYRPPYGTLNGTIRQAANDLGLVAITWDVDSADWNNASASAIVSAVGRLQDGQVILMHENQPNSLAAIPQIAANLEARDLCPGRLDPNTGRAIAP